MTRRSVSSPWRSPGRGRAAGGRRSREVAPDGFASPGLLRGSSAAPSGLPWGSSRAPAASPRHSGCRAGQLWPGSEARRLSPLAAGPGVQHGFLTCRLGPRQPCVGMAQTTGPGGDSASDVNWDRSSMTDEARQRTAISNSSTQGTHWVSLKAARTTFKYLTPKACERSLTPWEWQSTLGSVDELKSIPSRCRNCNPKRTGQWVWRDGSVWVRAGTHCTVSTPVLSEETD